MIPTLDDLLVFASDLTDESARASALVKLAPRLPADRLDAVLDVPISDEFARTAVMEAVLPVGSPAQVARIKAAAGQLVKVWPRYYLLLDLLPHLGEDQRDAVLEKLVATLERHPDVSLPERAARLAPLLRPDQLDRLIAVGLRGKERAFFLACVWDHVPESRLDALAAVLGADPADYHYFMGKLATRLDGEQLAALHDAATAIDDPRARTEALAHLAPRLPEPRRSAAIEESVAAAVVAMETQVESWRRLRLDALLPQTDHDQAGTLLAAERAARKRGMASNFTAIAPFVAPAHLAEVVAAAIAPARLGEPLPAETGLTIEELVKAVPYLPESLVDLAVRTILPRFDPVSSRIPRLTPGQAADVLRRIDVPDRPWQLARSIGYLGPFLAEGGLDEALAAVLAIGDEVFRGEALTDLAPCLDQARLRRVVDAANAIRNPDSRAYALVRLAPHAGDPGILRDALAAALSVRDPENQATRLLEVAEAQPAGDRAAALGPAWKALLTMPAGPGRRLREAGRPGAGELTGRASSAATSWRKTRSWARIAAGSRVVRQRTKPPSSVVYRWSARASGSRPAPAGSAARKRAASSSRQTATARATSAVISGPLVDDERGRELLLAYYAGYLDIARRAAPACSWTRRPGGPAPTGVTGSAGRPPACAGSTGTRSPCWPGSRIEPTCWSAAASGRAATGTRPARKSPPRTPRPTTRRRSRHSPKRAPTWSRR